MKADTLMISFLFGLTLRLAHSFQVQECSFEKVEELDCSTFIESKVCGFSIHEDLEFDRSRSPFQSLITFQSSCLACKDEEITHFIDKACEIFPSNTQFCLPDNKQYLDIHSQVKDVIVCGHYKNDFNVNTVIENKLSDICKDNNVAYYTVKRDSC